MCSIENGPEIRPNYHPNDEISFLWEPNTRLVELVYEPSHGLLFAIRQGGNTLYEDNVDSFKPLSWLKPLATAGVIKLPRSAEPHGTVDELAAKIQAFIHKYFDCSPELESVATLYVLHSWIYERFEAVPYLRFLGIPGSGKTRATQTIGGICYRPLVISGTASIATVYRQIEATGGTLLVDEGDFNNSQIGSDIGKILNNGYKRGFPVIRAAQVGDDWVPRPYAVFGPKVINGRRRFRDEATESRCLIYSPHQTGRVDIPRQLAAGFDAESLTIRNQALSWRLDTLDAVSPKELVIPDLRPRTNEIILPLLVIANQMQPDNRDRYVNDLISYSKSLDEQAAQVSRNSVEAMLVNAYVECCAKLKKQPTCSELARRVHSQDGSTKRWLNPRKTSDILRELGFTTHHTKRGAEVAIEPARLSVLCARFAISEAA